MNENFAKMFDPKTYAQSFDMKAFDFSKMISPDMLTNMQKWWPDMKATNLNSSVDMDALTASSKKNFDAITRANQLALQGMQEIMRRQADIFRETMETAGQLMADAMASGTPEEKLARQADLAKTAFETAARNMQQLATMVTDSQNECLKVINGRVSDSLDDLKSAVKKTA